ncbi:MAG: hypothetical protein ACTHJ3_07815, partial [Pararhizobium sp.]
MGIWLNGNDLLRKIRRKRTLLDASDNLDDTTGGQLRPPPTGVPLAADSTLPAATPTNGSGDTLDASATGKQEATPLADAGAPPTTPLGTGPTGPVTFLATAPMTQGSEAGPASDPP